MYGDDQLAETPPYAAARWTTAQGKPSREMAACAAALRCFCDPPPAQCAPLQELSGTEWKRLLRWLDSSGLALYFFDRVNELGAIRWLPAGAYARLKQNLADNTERTRALIAEADALEAEFQRNNLTYALLKGFSLWPHSAPKLELRLQSDLDYLVAENDAEEARRILEAKGYHRQAISGRTWEFKTTHPPARSLKDLYKPHVRKSVELHLEASGEGERSLLARREMRDFRGREMPVLPAVELFLWQGMHVFKHMCNDMARGSHLLEFRRHVIARGDDTEFWRQLQSMAGDSPRKYLGLGVATRLIEAAFGAFAPEELRCWSADRLPDGVRLWVDMHGYRSLLSNSPGYKLCLLLQQELAMVGIPAKRTLREQLLPLRLPPAITIAAEGEPPAARLRRAHAQLRFVLYRLRFHVVEGLRYLWAAARWRRQREERS